MCHSLTYPTQHNALKFPPYCHKWKNVLSPSWITYHYICISISSLSIHALSIDGHLGWLLWIMLQWIWGHSYLFYNPIFISFGCIPRIGIDSSYGNTILSFWGNSILFFIVATPIYIHPSSAWRFLFSNILTNNYCLFDDSHCNKCKVIIHCDFHHD